MMRFPGDPGVPRPHRLVRRLLGLYAAAAGVVVFALAAGRLASAHAPRMQALVREITASGLAGTALSSLLLAITALSATWALTSARGLSPECGASPAGGARSARTQRWRGWPTGAGPAARQGQALIVPVGALFIWMSIRLSWPIARHLEAAGAGNIAAAFTLGIAFTSLVAERIVNAFPSPQLPEAPALHRLLLLVTLTLAAGAALQLAESAGLEWAHWLQAAVACVPGLVATELALRALARLFLPTPQAGEAKAATDSLVAGLLTGGPRAPGALLRTHFGLDFARSWALSFLGKAALPALLLTAVLCWALSGLKLIDLEHRGIYERFGAPVAVLGPGLHALLPWPFGKLRTVEDGAIHSVPIGVFYQGTGQGTGAAYSAAAEPPIGAEATPPLSMNRLWETVHPDQAQYLVPSRGTGEQGFQSVDTEIFVLYRVGLGDRAALESLYAVADPGALVQDVANRVVLRYFNTRTLAAVLGASRQNVASELRAEIARDIRAYDAGLDVVSVLIEEIHPPVGAAAAYHAVQAAQINANASISDEIGRARRVAGVAQQERHQLLTAASAQAIETRKIASAAAYRFAADRRAYAEGRRAFLLERDLSDLESAVGGRPLTLLDDRLQASDGPLIDMRPAAASAAAAGSGPIIPSGPGIDQ
jgi:regulator of protease activity HflC (stomatin/prohibitin superfamily)